MKISRGSLLLIFVATIAAGAFILTASAKPIDVPVQKKQSHWFLLHRKSNVEYFYFGQSGKKDRSKLLKTFTVKTGIPGERPTPLPQLVNRKYWILTKKESSADNPETAPYFLTLNVPWTENEPFGPSPYLECGKQCNWILPGAFGLHGVNGDETRLSKENPGSSGCIRHKDEDITYLYNTLDPVKEEIRYYIEDI
jgi:lipoprotein-anchoring transpeptidase ErfK/SrfK